MYIKKNIFLVDPKGTLLRLFGYARLEYSTYIIHPTAKPVVWRVYWKIHSTTCTLLN